MEEVSGTSKAEEEDGGGGGADGDKGRITSKAADTKPETQP
jgi:hypothetical protein